MLRWSDVRLLYLREMRSALRERHIVVNSILIPIFLYPVLLWLAYTGIAFVTGQTERFTSRLMLRHLPPEHRLLRARLEADRSLELTTVEDPVAAIRSGSLDVLVEFLPPSPEAAALAGNFATRVTFDRSKDRSAAARERVAARIERYRQGFLEGEARRLGLPLERLQGFWVETTNVASGRQMGRFLMGLMLPLFLVIMLALGAFYPAIDATAGEREHSTWETLMSVASSRVNVVVAKYLYVATLSCAAGMLNLAAMTLTLKPVLAPILRERGEELTFRIPLASIPVILLGAALLALFVAAGMMILASFARTFKEGQSMVSPFYLVIFLPLLFLQVPDMELTPKLAAIPVVNVSLVFRDAIVGRYEWGLIAMTVAVETVCIAAALTLATAILRHEDFVLGSYAGGFGRFVKERLLGRRRAAGLGEEGGTGGLPRA